MSQDAFILLGQVALTVVASPYIAATLPFIGLVLYALQKFYLRTSKQLRHLDLEAKAPLISHILESSDGLATIRAFGRSEDFMRKALTLLDTSQKPYYLLYCLQRWLTLVLDLTSAGLTVLLVALAVVLKDRISTGFTALALVNLMTLNLYMMSVVILWTMLETSLAAVSRVKSFQETTPADDIADEDVPLPKDWPQNGQITFSNVSARYT